ncbi:glycosyltransferase [Vibrio salilacus]|uniref:glycosyltransferase n=1 Tax=Vibrio salilacus TaxID=1323749 RepID=UPI000C29ED5E|nr:glycosyltransferase family 2 protein [Vibrio salilacus]
MRYSIIIPVHNAIDYLPSCIESILSQNYDDYELIVSDDSSNDGTSGYLDSLQHKNLKVVRPEQRMTMVQHFEWAFQFATGKWVMYLGADDGLQAYFFELADVLTDLAEDKCIRTIMSSRAYYFWKSSQSLYGKTAVNYNARKEFTVLDTKNEVRKTLLSFQEYFELPEMYGTSLFRRDVILEAKNLQKGRIFATIPPDANLGAIAMSLEDKYLKSFIPLGWVGTSSDRISPVLTLPEDGVVEQGVEYHRFAGDYHIGSSALYFWNALLRTQALREGSHRNIVPNKLMKIFVFAGIHAEIKRKNSRVAKKQMKLFLELLALNRVSFRLVESLSFLMSKAFFISRVYGFVLNRTKNSVFRSYKFRALQGDEDVSINEYSLLIRSDLKNKGII